MTPDPKRKAQGSRLAAARADAGYRSARDAAISNQWPESSYRAHETGTRTIGDDDAERYSRAYRAKGAKVTARDILFPAGTEHQTPSPTTVGIFGYIGAGAQIEPDYEQVPPEGLDQVDVQMPLPADMAGFEVRGDSMTPRYDEGDVIICFNEQRRALETFYGEEAAVRTVDGRRFLKRIARGPNRRVVNLESFNAKTIEGVRLEWIGEIWITVRRGQFRRIEERERQAAKRAARVKRTVLDL